MTTRVLRKIVKIDEEKCNGCGQCAIACAEKALQIVNGKARLMSETYCDGLGACLGKCPQDAITIEEREAPEFDEETTAEHMEHVEEKKLACGCPSSSVREFDEECECGCDTEVPVHQPSMLRSWPVQLTLVPPNAPFLKGADVVLTAQCVPFAYAGYHQDFLKNHVALTACPKLDDFEMHQQQLNELIKRSGLKSLTVLHMEVPCCSGLVFMAKQAIAASGKDIPFKDITIGIRGDVK